MGHRMKALRYILAALVVSVASADTYYEKTTIPPTIAANKVLGNGTASTAAPQQLAVGSCSTTASALIWTTSTGFGCNTTINAGTLGGATFAAPGAIGGGTPAAGSFTTLGATSLLTASAGITATGADTNINATSNFNTNIGTGTTTGTVTLGQNSATPGSVVLKGPVSFQPGTAYTGASWALVSPVWNAAAATLNDTTASGTDAQEVAYSIQAANLTSTGAASTTVTNFSLLYLAAPTCSGGVVCSNLYSLFTSGAVKFNGLVNGFVGAAFSGGAVTLNNSSNFGVTIGGGTNNTLTTIGGTTSGNIVNIASISYRIGNVLYASVTAPTINAHFNTSSDTITAGSTAAFRVTVGTSTASNTGSLTFPAATTGWSCKVTDATTNASFIVEAFSTSTTAVTVNNYSRTTGLAANFTNSEKLDFLCGAF